MANRKISDLTALTAPATDDVLPIVDISEAVAANKNKKITYGELLASAPAGTAAAPSFSFDADPNTGIFNPAADTLAFAEGGVEVARLDSSGRLLVGTSTARSTFFNQTLTPRYQQEGVDLSGSMLSVTANGTYGPSYIIASRTRATSVGGTTAVVADDFLGVLSFQGSDGTDQVEAAQIYSQIDGTPGANDMPGRLVFSTTADGAAGPTERMRIDNAGRVLVGTATANTSGAKLQTSDGLTFPATAVASADPNTLDDYEEGTFTPSIGGDATYTSRSGTYIKVGRKVSIAGTFVINTKGTGSAAIVSGLPFAASALTPIYVGIFQNLAINVVFLLGSIPATTSRVDFTSIAAATGTTPNETSVIGNGTRIDYAATYFV
jgi:hypothetical protein